MNILEQAANLISEDNENQISNPLVITVIDRFGHTIWDHVKCDSLKRRENYENVALMDIKKGEYGFIYPDGNDDGFFALCRFNSDRYCSLGLGFKIILENVDGITIKLDRDMLIDPGLYFSDELIMILVDAYNKLNNFEDNGPDSELPDIF